MAEIYSITPIGKIKRHGDDCWIEVLPPYRDGLMGIGQFSHITVLFWCHQKDDPQHRSTLQVHPCKQPDNPLTGVFATRSPARPNPVAVTVCRLLQALSDRLQVADIDAFDQSPVIDIKGYFPDLPSDEVITIPDWHP